MKATSFLMASTTAARSGWSAARPGIWGGLWCFPEIAEPGLAATGASTAGGSNPDPVQLGGFRHTFSHYHLDIRPVRVGLPALPGAIMEAPDRLWYNTRSPAAIGLAAPVAALLEKLASGAAHRSKP